MSRTVNNKKEDPFITHAVEDAQINSRYERTQWYYVIALLNMFSTGKHTEAGGGDSYFMLLLGPYFLFYLAE